MQSQWTHHNAYFPHSLGRRCAYSEDLIETNFSTRFGSSQPFEPAAPGSTNLQGPPVGLNGVQLFKSFASVGPSHETLNPVRTQAVRMLGSFESVLAVSNDFFLGTHQRFSIVSRHRFYQEIASLTTGPRAEFVALCLCIRLVEQIPSTDATSMQSSLYDIAKSLTGLVEATSGLSLDVVHCRLLLTYYELGHGLHTAAYISIAACARSARALGLHRKSWRCTGSEANRLLMEEHKRAWWAVINLDRFVNMCNGDALFTSEDPESTDPLPIEDLLWVEQMNPDDLEGPIAAAPVLATPATVTVGQLARESQVLNLAGKVTRHVFLPTSDPSFNAEEAVQLERTLRAFLPLLAEEQLRIGNYCGAHGIANGYAFLILLIHDY